ncbi:hypothetical protein [Ottowia sp. SB7-C50]|uniref:hypothetical protein n=1 Tax=Ottowia sp. SB7-C50 TaxID=3081231 RepID=UPI002955C57D|nr:hypothetical protein [Ottowia sp. SB7-C50]WOP15772.1 hypothetical protein R0D99_01460 [Ottowia sp. SB7-C50]
MSKTRIVITALVAIAFINSEGERIVIDPGKPAPPLSDADKAALLEAKAIRIEEERDTAAAAPSADAPAATATAAADAGAAAPEPAPPPGKRKT